MVRFHLPRFDYEAYGYTVRHDGYLKFRQGDFGSSACCWATRLVRIAPRTFSTRFLPWWIRTGEDQNLGVRYRARTRICRHPCVVDFTREAVIA